MSEYYWLDRYELQPGGIMWRILMVGLFLGSPLVCQAMGWTAEQRALFQEQLTNDRAVATVALLVDIPESRLRELQNTALLK